MNYQEYLDFEARSPTKHEYVRGEVVAMAGGTLEHARLAMSFGHLLAGALEGKPCVVLSSDARVRIAETDRATYPDLAVACGSIERASDDPEAIVNPLVLVEVLSDSTESSDRGEKFPHYRRLASLQEYVLVAQDEVRIEIFRRDGTGWKLEEALAGSELELRSLGVRISVDAVYRDPLSR